jgi:hypothetical protein
MPDSLVIAPSAPDDDARLASLSRRAGAHRRREVLPRDRCFEVEFLRRGSRRPGERELEQLHELYRNVRDRGLEVNSIELPPTLLADMLEHDCGELMVLRLADKPVAFGAHFVGARHYAPLLVGLDYDYVRSHGAYRQAIRQALLRARKLGLR